MPGILRGAKSRVQRLEIENFKSYRGRQEVGPFYAFTAVIGPNGSGKSNIMDAVSFVLGVKGAQLRGSLKELLYSYTEGQQVVRPETGYVKLVLETDGEDDTSFQRTIVMGRSSDTYSSQYAINERTVSWAAYEEKLKTFGILVKARNFLVFQGDIEAVASKQPPELTKLLESISGSETFKADYEKYDADRRAAQEKLAFIQSKKRNTAAEKRQKKEQKVEAERHIKLQEQLEVLKSKYYLWQLYHSQMDAETAAEELEGKQAELREAAKQMKAADNAVKAKKKGIAGLIKQRVDLEHKAKKRRAEADKKNPEQRAASLAVDMALKKVQDQETKLAEEKKKQEGLLEEARTLQKKRAIFVEEQKQLENAPSDGNKLSEEHFSEYLSCKEKAKTRTARARGELHALQGQQATDERALDEAKSDLARIEEQLQKLAAEAQARKQSQKEQEQDLLSSKAELKAKKARLKTFGFESRQIGTERAKVEANIAELEDQLQEFKASEKQEKKEIRAQEIIREMKDLYKGVYGRVSDLGKVTQQSYSLALALAMGPSMDSVVVDNEASAKDCIGFLKLKREHPMTFIPLATVKAHRPHERLRTLGGTAKLAIDLLEFDPKLEKAFNSVCGNTLICDHEAEAKQLGFGSGVERYKVVTKGGLLIAKTGAMTGGGSGDFAAKAARFDQAHIHRLKQDKQQCEGQLSSLPAEQARQKDQASLESEVKRLENSVSNLEAKIRTRLESGTGTVQPTEPLLKQKAEITDQIEKTEREMEEQQGKINEYVQRMNNVEDAIYADLSQKTGIENLRMFLSENEEQVKTKQAQLSSVKLKIVSIDTQLKYFKTNNQDTLRALEEALQKQKDRLSEKQQEAEKSSAATAAREAKSKSEGDNLRALRQKIEVAEAEARELQSKDSQQLAISKKLHAETKELEAALEDIALKQSEILKAAQLEQVDLLKEDDGAEAMETDNPSADTASAVAALNFDSLSRQQKARLDKKAQEQLDSEFAAGIEEQQSALAKVLPNLKAVEQYEEAKEKDDKEKAELDQARQVNRETANAFHAVRQQRAEAYMKAFDHIKDVINPIYKDLTKSSGHPLGGTAYLSMTSSEDEPFLSGVIFTAMPPSKRWRQMEALSGGEKTVAALALLFAIHSFHPSPFFVLDEVDAALDASNVAKVATYIRERTRTEEGKEQFQAIVISLKDYFFSKADAIVGVTKHPHHGCSQTFTLDLNQYGQPEQ